MSPLPVTGDVESRAGMPLVTRIRFAFDVFVILMFVSAGIGAIDFRPIARYMPMFIAVLGTLLATVNLVLDVLLYRRTGSAVAIDASSTAALREVFEDGRVVVKGSVLRPLYYFGWVLTYLLAIRVIGIAYASVLFLCAFLYFEGRVKWHFALLSGVIVFLAINGISDLMNLRWPRSFFFT